MLIISLKMFANNYLQSVIQNTCAFKPVIFVSFPLQEALINYFDTETHFRLTLSGK